MIISNESNFSVNFAMQCDALIFFFDAEIFSTSARLIFLCISCCFFFFQNGSSCGDISVWYISCCAASFFLKVMCFF